MTINESIIESFKGTEVGTVYSTGEIKELVHQKFGVAKGSIIPSDICYNSSNHGVEKANYHKNNKRLFVKIGRGYYEYVGPLFDANSVNPHEFGTV